MSQPSHEQPEWEHAKREADEAEANELAQQTKDEEASETPPEPAEK